jgi:hypothetical protein
MDFANSGYNDIVKYIQILLNSILYQVIKNLVNFYCRWLLPEDSSQQLIELRIFVLQ